MEQKMPSAFLDIFTASQIKPNPFKCAQPILAPRVFNSIFGFNFIFFPRKSYVIQTSVSFNTEIR